MDLSKAMAYQQQAQAELTAANEAYAASVKAAAEETAKLKTIKVDPANIKFLVAEFDLPVLAADRMLKEANGDINVVLEKLIESK